MRARIHLANESGHLIPIELGREISGMGTIEPEPINGIGFTVIRFMADMPVRVASLRICQPAVNRNKIARPMRAIIQIVLIAIQRASTPVTDSVPGVAGTNTHVAAKRAPWAPHDQARQSR